MKHIFLNLKRFDVPAALGGVNRIAPIESWGRYIVENTQEALKHYDPSEWNLSSTSLRPICWGPWRPGRKAVLYR